MSLSYFATSEQPGRLVTGAVLDVDDHGFTVGDGIYETIRTVNAVPQLLERHLARMAGGAQAVGLPHPGKQAIEHAIGTLSALPELADTVGRLRLTLTSGHGPAGLARGSGWTLAATWNRVAPAASALRLITSSIRRNQQSPLCAVKSTSAAELVWAAGEAAAVAADEALLLNLAGEIAEGARCSVFLVIDGKAFTPPLSAGALPGVVRGWLLETQSDLVAERTLTPADLAEASEVFITSAVRGVHPVSAVDQHRYPECGGVTAELMARFRQSEVTS